MSYCDRDTIFGSREDRIIKALILLGLVLVIITFMSTILVNPDQHGLAQISSTTLTYQNPDIGFSMQYPPNWIKQQGNLLHNTIVAFELKPRPFGGLDFANITLAEVDLRVYGAPQSLTPAKLNLTNLPIQHEAVISNYKNNTTTLGGLPAVGLTSYLFEGVTEKTMQRWTVVPNKHMLIEVIYIVQPSQYCLYLPDVEKMIDSIKITQ